MEAGKDKLSLNQEIKVTCDACRKVENKKKVVDIFFEGDDLCVVIDCECGARSFITRNDIVM